MRSKAESSPLVSPELDVLVSWPLEEEAKAPVPGPPEDCVDDESPFPEEPVPDDPVLDDPPPDDPLPDDPVPDDPVPDDPAPEEPVPEEPVPGDPVPEEPVPVEPVPAEPVSEELVELPPASRVELTAEPPEPELVLKPLVSPEVDV
ncbi:MAG: hypothetical protein Q9219_000537 [cf. Caloplaca sp. 3 TL-2023]